MIKSESFITIQGWMITQLGLSGASLIIYAIIYSFSQDGDSVYKGSRQYLADWCNCSISGVKKCLKQLQENGLIIQVLHSIDNQHVHYKANLELVSQSDQGGLGHKVTEPRSQSDQGGVTKVTEPRSQSDQAYKDDNIEDTLNDNIVGKIVVCDSAPRARFKKPTREEVKAYAERNGAAVVNPDRFYDYYEANGWKVGKNQMKDWKAALRNWERMNTAGARAGSGAKKPEDVPYMQKEYTKEHLEQKEADSMRVLDDLLGGET